MDTSEDTYILTETLSMLGEVSIMFFIPEEFKEERIDMTHKI